MDRLQLKAWREARGFSQRKMAALLGVSRETVVRWETEKLKIQHGKMLGLACETLEREGATEAAP